MGNWKRAILGLLFLPLLAACGQIQPLGMSSRRIAMRSQSALNSGYSESSAQSCRYNDLIQPEQDLLLDGSGYYSVCAGSTAATTSVKIYGDASGLSKQVCIFPAQVLENGQVWPKFEIDGRSVVSCAALGETGVSVAFEELDYNALFIVPEVDRDQMEACLVSADYFSCPSGFSFGKFR